MTKFFLEKKKTHLYISVENFKFPPKVFFIYLFGPYYFSILHFNPKFYFILCFNL
jgi:hypothetical protein